MRHLQKRWRSKIDENAELVKSLNVLIFRIILLVALITFLVREVVATVALLIY